MSDFDDQNEEKSRRGRIIKAAYEVFIEAGYHGASIRRIARKAAVNEALIYHYFQNKEDLFFSLLGETYEEMLMRVFFTEGPFSETGTGFDDLFTSRRPSIEEVISKQLELLFKRIQNKDLQKFIRLMITTVPLVDSPRRDEFFKMLDERMWRPFSQRMAAIIPEPTRQWLDPYIFFRIFLGAVVSYFLFQDIMKAGRVIDLPYEDYAGQLARFIENALKAEWQQANKDGEQT